MSDFVTYGLVGEDIARSFSPRIYNHIFNELNLAAVYMPFSVARERLLSALPILRESFAGFNVTAPFRRDIVPHLDQLDETAKRAGTANTIAVKDQKLIGYNTEMVGFERSLIGFAGNFHDKDVLLVGAGGVASSVASVLLEKGAFLTLVSRNEAHTERLKQRLENKCHKNRLRIIKGLSDADRFDAVFNTAKVDLEGNSSDIYIHPHTYQSFKYAYDTAYVPTDFLKKAQSYGAKTKNGFDMLFYQAIMSVKIWTGREMNPQMIERIHKKIVSCDA